jgi:hypothetical protein
MNSVPNPQVVKPSLPLSANRRRGNRHRLHIPATLLNEGDSAVQIPVTITELSIGGVALRCKESLPLDRVYQLSSFDTLVPPGMRIRVVSQQPGAAGEFKIGAQTI